MGVIVNCCSTFAAKIVGITQEVKSLKNGEGSPTDVILTKVHVSMNDEEYEIAAWSHTGVLLAHLLGGYMYETVGFAYIEASSWVGRTAAKINLLFGADSKVKLPEERAEEARPRAAAPKEIPATLLAIGGFEGQTQCKCQQYSKYAYQTTALVNIPVQLVKDCESIDDQYVTVAGDSNRHKVQLSFDYKPATAKGECVLLKTGHIAQSGKVLTITVKKSADAEHRAQPLFESLTLAELTWPSTVKIEASAETPANASTDAGNADTADEATPRVPAPSARSARAARRI
jgi:hypothetical protein